MAELSLDKIKRLELDVLSDVAAFCEQSNLRYFLAYGTLLGAVRHRGFIPWDDDVDIWMPRPDYETFLRSYVPSRNPACRLIDSSREKRYGLTFAKVYDARTIVREAMYRKDGAGSYGVYVDVFPLDGFAGRRQWFVGHLLQKALNVKNATFGTGRSWFKAALMRLTKVLLLPFPTAFLVRLSDRNATKVPFDASAQVGFLSDTRSFMVAYPKSDFDSTVGIFFEGRSFRAPRNFDDVLRRDYGDYMTLPPPDKRVSTHHSTAYWRE